MSSDLCGDYRLTDYERHKPKMEEEPVVWVYNSDFVGIVIVPDDSDTDSEL